ncbi:MAG: Rdx family protein [Proteobacteria bacterium]|nr:Rdx family protein [Pseudomonadota bacterium]MBU1234303.1 Rdx family protein [Pseudomonadota bacterium]MBU1417883.1 Rdx family protein [Pseudomonadota bacterium]MBU1453405.1 Rdx family protein [Pseudomonadota bacterium]
MEEELKKEFDADVELIASSGGVYEIVLDGEKIFSKKALNRFPDDGEISKLIQGRR